MFPALTHRWMLRGEVDPAVAASLAGELRISSLVASLTLQRGVTNAASARRFLDGRLADMPDPFTMTDMEAAVQRLCKAVQGEEPIAVHGDYDVDGITASALLVENLRAFGAQVEYYIPLRLVDGYGLSGEALQRAAARGARVAVSVDCGVSALAEARLARELGLDLIITDHHQPPQHLPEAFAVLNPHRPDCGFPDKDLAGVGVAFMLLVALRCRLRELGWFRNRPEPDLRHSLDLVALGTIADIAPLRGLNRMFVKAGLAVLNHGRRPGVSALKQVADVAEVTSGSVGFRLAPRLNAAGRLQDAAQGVALLLEESFPKALSGARCLDECNRERQTIEQQTLDQALVRLAEGGDVGRCSIVLADARWHPGVIGIVASRLVERFHRPTVLVALENGTGKGSARSIGGFHLYRALETCGKWLKGFGGHEFAAGLTIDEGRIKEFAEAFDKLVREQLSEEDLQPRHLYDAEVSLDDLTLGTVAELEKLAPFGAGNPQPLLLVRNLRIERPEVLKDKHLRFVAVQGGTRLACIAFGMAHRRGELAGDIDILFTPSVNQWRDRREVRLNVRDLRPVAATVTDAAGHKA